MPTDFKDIFIITIIVVVATFCSVVLCMIIFALPRSFTTDALTLMLCFLESKIYSSELNLKIVQSVLNFIILTN